MNIVVTHADTIGKWLTTVHRSNVRNAKVNELSKFGKRGRTIENLC